MLEADISKAYSYSISELLLSVIDKNWLWGELNIMKGKLGVKGILAQDLGFVLGILSGV
jgi:hypothetical protein